MSNHSKQVKLALLTLVSFGAFSTMGFNSSQSISAVVPLVCHVEFQSNGVQEANSGIVETGSAREFCNSRKGYRVLARANGLSKSATINVDGKQFYLSGDQELEIAQENGPAILNRNISINNIDSKESGTLSFRLEAK